MASTYIYAENYADFEKQLRETWDLPGDYRLVDVENIDDNAWTGVFVDNGKANAFEAETNFADIQERIEVRQSEGYDLIDLDYVDDEWTAVFDTNFVINQGSDYELAQDMNEFAEDTKKQFDNGFQLTDVEYADGNWVSVFGNPPEQSAYSISDSLTGFKSGVASRRGQGFDLVGMEYAEDTWVSVFAKKTRYSTKYAIANDTSEFLEKFYQRREQGYDLIDYEQVDDIYLGVYEKPDVIGADGLEALEDSVATIAAANSLAGLI